MADIHNKEILSIYNENRLTNKQELNNRFFNTDLKKYEFNLKKIKKNNKNKVLKKNKNSISYNENKIINNFNSYYDNYIENSILNSCKRLNKPIKNILKNTDCYDNNCLLFNDMSLHNSKYRKINEMVYKVWDAPGIKDDYYSSILDWNDNNYILICLNLGIYLWCPKTLKVEKIKDYYSYLNHIDLDQNRITSLKSMNYEPTLVIGTFNGNIKFLNYETKTETFSNNLGCFRIATLDTINNMICFGNKKGYIIWKDIREKKNILEFYAHDQEICKVQFRDDSNFLALGCNNNTVSIFDIKKMKILFNSYSHSSGVRALSWDKKNKNIIYSGGGNNDKTIKIWDIRNTMDLKKTINTGSQVCNLIHSKNTNELISSHGYNDNNICIWNIDNHNYNLEKIAVLKNNIERVLHLSLSPCGENIVSGSGDESLRFYNPFPKKREANILDSEKFLNFLR